MIKVILILMQFYYMASFSLKEFMGVDYECFLSNNFAFSCEGSYSGGFAGISYINKNYYFNFSVIGNNNHIKCLIGTINSYGKVLGYFNINYSEYFKNSKLDWNIGIKMNIQSYIYKNHNFYIHFKTKLNQKMFKFNKQEYSYVDKNDISFSNGLNVSSMSSKYPVMESIFSDSLNNKNTIDKKKDTCNLNFLFKIEDENAISDSSVSGHIRLFENYNFSSEKNERKFKNQNEICNAFTKEKIRLSEMDNFFNQNNGDLDFKKSNLF